MNKENELLQAVNKSVKNTNTKTQSTITETIKETRGRKAGTQIPEIISNNEESYKNADRILYNGCQKTQNIKTYKDSLAR